MLAGAVHCLATLRDVNRPTFFAPVDRSVLPRLESTGIRFRELFAGTTGAAPSPSMWRAWLGFNLSHGLGLLAFGLLCFVLGTDDFDLVTEIDSILPLTIVVSATYLVLSIRFWFWVPTLIIGVGAACFTVASVLSL
jgi:hypothetical protein